MNEELYSKDILDGLWGHLFNSFYISAKALYFAFSVPALKGGVKRSMSTYWYVPDIRHHH
jgi:hypothetical protein